MALAVEPRPPRQPIRHQWLHPADFTLKTVGVSVATPTLPVQAIVPDKDTWIDGDFGFQLDRAN